MPRGEKALIEVLAELPQASMLIETEARDPSMPVPQLSGISNSPLVLMITPEQGAGLQHHFANEHHQT